MKRILFMHQASTIGGGSYCLLNILKVIDRSVFKPVVALMIDGPLRKEIEKLEIEVIFFREMAAIPYNRSLFKLNSLHSYLKIQKSIPKFKEILKTHHIDVVYLNNMMLYKYLKSAKYCGIKTVIHIREHWPLNEHKTQLKWAREAVNNYADLIVAINHFSASIFPKSKGKMNIVYDWIDMKSRYEYRPLSEILGEDSTNLKVYLYTGGVQRIKGAVEVIKSFSSHITDSNSRLLVVGISPQVSHEGMKNKLKLLLAHLGIKSYLYKVKEAIECDPRIRCIPATYMLSHIMEQCYCNLSYFTIPHANLALAEAEIMGLPSIAADNEEANEYSLSGSLSLLYKQNSLEDFHNAISMYEKEYFRLQKNIQIQRNNLVKMFSKEENACRLNNLLNKLIES